MISNTWAVSQTHTDHNMDVRIAQLWKARSLTEKNMKVENQEWHENESVQSM